MSTKAFLFPGQGAQAPGMGRSLFDNFTEAKRTFEMASDVMHRDIKALCFETDAADLARTENAQPALLVVSLASFMVLASLGLCPDAAAGFSLGECATVTAAGCLSPEDGLSLVGIRAQAMRQAAQAQEGRMAAVLGLDFETVERICEQIPGFVVPVNDNCPGQVVMAGAPAPIDAACEACLAQGARRALKLELSGAFHTEHMAPAAVVLRDTLQTIPVAAPKFPLYLNLTGQRWDGAAPLDQWLSDAVCRPVRFRGCVQAMIADGADTFIEVGWGKTLSGFVRRIHKETPVLPAATAEDMKALLSLEGRG